MAINLLHPLGALILFQSLKGFQRFCGQASQTKDKELLVSIPKRVSEVLWQYAIFNDGIEIRVSIPKRVSEVLWL